VGTALTEAEAGNLIVGADGVVQVAPTSQVEREASCQGFSNTANVATTCTQIEFCEYDETTGTCSAKPAVSVVVIVIIVVVVLLLIGGLYYWFFVRDAGGGGGGGGGGKTVQMGNKPAVGIPGPPPKKPKKTGPKPLKPGWKAVVDKDSGDTYFYNADSGATTWERHLIEQ